MYDLPQFNFTDFKNKVYKVLNSKAPQGISLVVIIIILSFLVSITSVSYFQNQFNLLLQKTENNLLPQLTEKPEEKYVSRIEYEQAIIDAVREASPSVVSIIISKNLPVYEQQFINPFGEFPDFGSPFNFQIPQYVQKGTEKQEVGAGSGFIVSEDGLILTNKHVVLDKQAEYTVLTNDGKKYSAKVLALDPVQDLAIIKIQDDKKFPAIKLGDSSAIQIGQGVIAIGNALGEFRNTVSVGVISGLGRTISASGTQGFSETLEGIIQTDAAINLGNSGGPLLNLKGEVIGVNTATAEAAQSIGFAIPINIAKRDIDQIIKTNKIVYPFLGVRYVLIDEKVKQKYNLSVDYGALLLKGSDGQPAVNPDSAAEKAGLKEKDIILEFNPSNFSGQAGDPPSPEASAGQGKITKDNSMSKIIAKYNPGDKVTLKVLRDGKEININVILGER